MTPDVLVFVVPVGLVVLWSWGYLLWVRRQAPQPCICATPEYPHFDRACPEHGRLTPSTGSYDQRNQHPVRQCSRCPRSFHMAGDVCHECQDAAR